MFCFRILYFRIMAVHLVSSRTCCGLLHNIRYMYNAPKNSSLVAAVKQSYQKGILTTKQWMKPPCRQYHHNQYSVRIICLRHLSNIAKQRHECHTRHGCFRRLWLFQRFGSYRIYSTKTGKVAVSKSSKKIAVPKISEIGRLLSLARPEKKPLFCKYLYLW